MSTKLLTFSLLTALFLSSCNPNNPQPTPTPTANSNWKFKLTINGITNRAEGTGYNVNSNYCVATGGAGTYVVSLFINDLASPSYISGSQGSAIISLQYPVVGVNPIAYCNIGSVPWINNVLPANALSSGYSLTLNGTMVPNSIGASHLRLPLNITDLGSPGSNDYINFGNPLKGSYSGTIYMKSSMSSSYDTPVTIDLDFIALRP